MALQARIAQRFFQSVPSGVWLAVAFMLAGSVFLYAGGLENLWFRWGQQDEYSHGYVIPLVSLYIIWENRYQLASQIDAGAWWGLPLLSVSMLIFLVGEMSALFILIHYSYIGFLFAVSLLTMGKKMTRALFTPIALLLFCIPLPYFIEIILTSKLQLWSTQVGVAIIEMFRIPVFVSGNLIDLGAFKIQVVEACSGLRYLFPLMCVSSIAAYFYKASMTKRVILFLSTIPLTLLMNSIRIGVIGLLVSQFGPKAAEGFIHDFEGWSVFFFCLVILFGEVLLLEKLTTRKRLSQIFFVPPLVESRALKAQSNNRSKAGSMFVILTLTFLAINAYDKKNLAAQYTPTLSTFPLYHKGWSGVGRSMGDGVVEGLGMDDYFMADYYREDNRLPVNLYIAFYANQTKGNSPHSPRVCIPGGGWEIVEFSRTHLPIGPVNRSVIQKGLTKHLVYYYFVERGEVIANEYLKKWKLLNDALFLGRSDGALVRVVVPIGDGASIFDAEVVAQEFITSFNRRLLDYLPGNS